jgi:hypothetical protein
MLFSPVDAQHSLPFIQIKISMKKPSFNFAIVRSGIPRGVPKFIDEPIHATNSITPGLKDGD